MVPFLLSSVLALVPLPPLPQDAAQDPGAEDVEVMRRLLVEAIDATRSTPWRHNTPLMLGSRELPLEGIVISPGLVATDAVTHSRGFRAPGVGALFTLDVQVPAVEARAADAGGEEEEAEDDAWERMKREVRSGKEPGEEVDPLLGTFYEEKRQVFDTFSTLQQRRWTLAPEAIEAATDAVLATLADHGARIRDLGPGDPITVALHFEPATLVTSPLTVGAETVEGEETSTPWTRWVSVYGAGSAPPQRVVVRVTPSELRSLDGGGKEGLRRLATIHRY